MDSSCVFPWGRTCPIRPGGLLALIAVLCAGQVLAQAPQAPPPAQPPPDQGTSSSRPIPGSPSEKPFHRWGLGGIASYLPFNLMKGGASSNSTETLGSKPEGLPLGGGVTTHFFLTHKFSLSLDLIYHRVGYDASQELSDSTSTTYYMRTRANYYDFPLLFRYEWKRLPYIHQPIFFEAGVVGRYVSAIETSTTTNVTVSSALESTCCGEIPDKAAHRLSPGMVAGIGLMLPTDDFGIRVTPEIRYTHWVYQTFLSLPTQSRTDQLEVVFSISF